MFFGRGSGSIVGSSEPKKATSKPAKVGAAKDDAESGKEGKDGTEGGFNESDRAQGKKAPASKIAAVKPDKTATKKAEEKKENGTPDEKGDCEVEIEMDPAAPECADDKYILKSADGKFRKVMTVKDDQVPGDKVITLSFKDIPGGTTYTLEIDPGKEGAPYTVFENIPFKRLIAAGKKA